MGLGKYIYKLNYKFLMRNVILMESNPDYMDNTRAVFDQMIKDGLNNKYKIIWCVDNKKIFNDIKIKNVKFIERNDKFINKLIFDYYNIFAKVIVDCNKYIYKRNKNQFRIHLTHGPFFKTTYDYSSMMGRVNYVVMPIEEQRSEYKRVFNVTDDQIFVCDFPRCDYLYDDNPMILYPDIKRDKTIMWMPTYRNHKNKGKNKTTFKYGIPGIDSKEDLIELNNLLKKEHILLIIKIHPAEDTTFLTNLKLSNVVLLDNDIFVKNHTMIYQYLNSMDALITDYSSIYFDFLVTKKPIGLACPDMDEYIKNVGIYFKDYEKDIVGEYIYNFNDLKKFILNVSNGNDSRYKDRLKAIKRYNKYNDNQCSKRIVDLIKQNMNGR